MEDEEDVDKPELERAEQSPLQDAQQTEEELQARAFFFPLLVEMIASGGKCGGTCHPTITPTHPGKSNPGNQKEGGGTGTTCPVKVLHFKVGNS